MHAYTLRIVLVFGLMLSLLSAVSAAAFSTDEPRFERVWARTDLPVAQGDVDRTWIWGPEAHTGVMMEPYADAPGGERAVQYTDKSRMEDNSYRADSPWDVTNGLIALELITGKMQLGDDEFAQHSPAEIQVAGDPDEGSPTYATFNQVLDHAPLEEGATITQTIAQDGSVGSDEALAAHNVTASYYVPEASHVIASPFWEFMNAQGLVHVDGELLEDDLFETPFFATGFPVTEAYWMHVPVGGEMRDVLAQCFERRCLTYTPGNPDGWQVEAGNIGQAYYHWRYVEIPASEADQDDVVPRPDETSEPTPTPEPTATPEPTSTPTPDQTATPPTPSTPFSDRSTSSPSPTPTPETPSTPSATPEPTPTPDTSNQASCLNSFEREILRLINEYREGNGLQPLANSEALNIASFNHSKDMGERGYFAHETPEGLSPFDRMDQVGYTYNTAKAENIAAGYQSARAVFDAWRASPGHNANMLHPDMKVIGIGRAEVSGSEYGVYWTTKFGGRIDAAPSC